MHWIDATYGVFVFYSHRFFDVIEGVSYRVKYVHQTQYGLLEDLNASYNTVFLRPSQRHNRKHSITQKIIQNNFDSRRIWDLLNVIAKIILCG